MAFDDISEAMVAQYTDNVVHLFQAGSVLRGKVRERSVTGASDFWDLIGPTAAVKRTVRHSDTPQITTPLARRRVDLADWEYSDLLDLADQYKILISPRSEYAVAGAKALARAYDSEIIRAFDGDAHAGKEGGTVVPFISEGTDLDLSDHFVMLRDIIDAKLALDNHDVDDENRHIILPPCGLQQLLVQSVPPNATSKDYAAVKALVKGRIDEFLGMTWHKSTLLPRPGPGLRYGYVWAQSAIGLSISADLITSVTERADKSYATQVLCAATLGATRIQPWGVVRLKIRE
jgi:hypothetical protein